jgi:hypothetical protein
MIAMEPEEVVLFDDNHAEIAQIGDTLSALNVRYKEYDPTEWKVIKQIKSNQSVKVIFLDLHFGGAGLKAFDPDQPAGLVNSIVPDKQDNVSHPYFLVIWTMDTDDAMSVLNVLHRMGKSPVGHLAAQKNRYLVGNQLYDIKRLFKNIPKGFLEAPKMVDTVQGQIIDVQDDHVLVNCRMSEEKAIFQVRRFDKGPFKGVVTLDKNVFVRIDIGTENGKRTIEFSQINDDISKSFVKDEMFEEFRDSPFSSDSQEQ